MMAYMVRYPATMKIADWFLEQLEREAGPTRRTLERVPDGRRDWKPHEKSMPLGYLSELVARLPSWIGLIVKQEEHDLNPPGGSGQTPPPLVTSTDLVRALDESVRIAREALTGATDEHLMKPWRLLVSGRVVSEQLRHVAICDSVFSHLAHHRGQLTVYLRLNDAPVPSVYGPSADDKLF